MTTAHRRVAEGLGTALLLAIVVGSGSMGQRLSGGNDAIALLGNTIATGAGLVVLIHIFGPISGAHFNPAVTIAQMVRREIGPGMAAGYIAVQGIGAVLGVWIAHAMFAEPLLQVSTKLRDGPGQGFAEAVATFGLLGTIWGTQRAQSDEQFRRDRASLGAPHSCSDRGRAWSPRCLYSDGCSGRTPRHGHALSRHDLS